MSVDSKDSNSAQSRPRDQVYKVTRMLQSGICADDRCSMRIFTSKNTKALSR